MSMGLTSGYLETAKLNSEMLDEPFGKIGLLFLFGFEFRRHPGPGAAVNLSRQAHPYM